MTCSQTGNNQAPEVNEKMSHIKHKIIVLSGKGGVGKSTVAVNLATALALEGKKVGILDVDLHGPTVPQMLGLKNEQPVILDEHSILPVEVTENLKAMSVGFLLSEEDGAVVWRGPMKANAIKQFLGDVEWGELDYLIVDSPPGTGDEPLSVCQGIDNIDGAVIVTTPQEAALTNVRRSIKFCSLLNLKVLGVIENMAGFVCPSCGEVTHVFSQFGGETMAKKAGVPFLASVPLDPMIVTSGDSGKPYIYHHSDSPAAKAFTEAVLSIMALEDEDEPQSVENISADRDA
jgi:ATP-binding protein involved in chromosome partitioning